MPTPPNDLFGVAAVIDEETPPYVILQILAADGWRVVFGNDTATELRFGSLACFALVEMIAKNPDGPPQRGVRPMAVDDDGEVNDVDAFDDFICLISPAGMAVPPDLMPMIQAALERRAAANDE